MIRDNTDITAIDSIIKVNNKKYTDLLSDSFYGEINTPRDGWHFSDVLYCLKKAALHKKFKDYKISDDNELHTLLNGKMWHEGVQHRLVSTFPGRFLVEHEIKYKEFVGHPDLIDVKDNVIIELKTVKTAYALTVGKSEAVAKKDHMKQIMCYMAATGIYDGVIIYHVLSTAKGEPEMYEFPVSITESAATMLLREMDSKLKIAKRDPSLIPVDEFTKSWDTNWLCMFCPFATAEHCPEGLGAKQMREHNKIATVGRVRRIK